jgi:Fe-Mn family superoxide dismutase
MEGLYAWHRSNRNRWPSPRQIGSASCPLPYAYDALEPYIDKETLTLHHDKHHAAYVSGFNAAMKKLEEARASADYSLIKHWSREFAFHGSGHVLHSLYWANMSARGGEPKDDLLEALKRGFGSLDQFKKQFISATNTVEASGWGILAYEPYMGHLSFFRPKNTGPDHLGSLPLLICDVWEYAYYLKYQNCRANT